MQIDAMSGNSMQIQESNLTPLQAPQNISLAATP
jgi:hypothetical protein